MIFPTNHPCFLSSRIGFISTLSPTCKLNKRCFEREDIDLYLANLDNSFVGSLKTSHIMNF